MAFLGLWFVIDTFSNMDDILIATKDMGGWEIFKNVVIYYAYQVPGVFAFIAPIVVLIASVFVIRHLTQFNELTAFKASGIAIHRMVMPLFVAAFAVSVLMVANREYVIPRIAPYKHDKAKMVSGRIKSKEIKDAVKTQNQRFAEDTGLFYQTIQVDDLNPEGVAALSRIILQGEDGSDRWRFFVEGGPFRWDASEKTWSLEKLHIGFFLDGTSDLLFSLLEDERGLWARVRVSDPLSKLMGLTQSGVADAYKKNTSFSMNYGVDRSEWSIYCQGIPQSAAPENDFINFEPFSSASFYSSSGATRWDYQIVCNYAMLNVKKKEWWFFRPRIMVYSPLHKQSIAVGYKTFVSPRSAEYFVHEEARRNPDELTIKELRRLRNFPKFRFELYSRIVEPLVPIILMLLGISLALSGNESKHALVGIGYSVAVCAAFYLSVLMFRSLGMSMPGVAALMPHFIFFGVGAYLYAKVET